MFHLLIVLLFSVYSAAGPVAYSYVTIQNLTSIKIDATRTAKIKYGIQSGSHLNTSYLFSDAISYGYTYLRQKQTQSIQTTAAQTIQIKFSEVVQSFSVLLYCLGWPSGTYTFKNFAVIQSQSVNKAGSITTANGKSTLTVANGKNFAGIIEFPFYAHVNILQWTGVAQSGKKLVFGVGILYPVNCTVPSVGGSLKQGTCTGKYNSQCSYTCKPGYYPATYQSAHCIKNGTYQFTGTNKLPSVCSRCGDHVLNKNNGEFCDDGNVATGDGCDENCHIEPDNFALFGPGKFVCLTATVSVGPAALYILNSPRPVGADTQDTLLTECNNALPDCNRWTVDAQTNMVTFFNNDFSGSITTNYSVEASFTCNYSPI